MTNNLYCELGFAQTSLLIQKQTDLYYEGNKQIEKFSIWIDSILIVYLKIRG